MPGHGFLEGVQRPVRIVGVRAGELGLDAQRPGGVLETRLSRLPVRQSDVGRDKNVAFVFLVEGLLARGEKTRGEENGQVNRTNGTPLHALLRPSSTLLAGQTRSSKKNVSEPSLSGTEAYHKICKRDRPTSL